MSKEGYKRNVVIVGGGYAGALLARSLSGSLDPRKYSLILINERPFAIHLLAGARMTVSEEGDFEHLAIMPYDNLFINGNGRVVVGRVTAIEETARGKGGWVVLQSGPLDFPYSQQEMHEHIQSWRRMYERANHIVLVGGGAVGIETAGELRDIYPNKKITIVQADDMLLNATYPLKYRKDIEQRVRARGIDMIFSELTDYIPQYGTMGLTTRSGMSLPTADLIVPTFGPRPNTAWIASLDPAVLDERHLVKVGPTFEVVNHPGVFAIGDITDCNEQKQALKYAAHATVAAANILSFLEGQSRIKKYQGSRETILIPIGRSRGSAYFDMLWGIVLGDWFVRWMKGSDLLVNRARRDRGL